MLCRILRCLPSALFLLETGITASNDVWAGKGINYRMHPRNVAVLNAARIDVCTLANNHVLDWRHPGLLETLETLQKAGIKYCGAGRNFDEAAAPAITAIEGKGRVIVFSYGVSSSGIPPSWAASKQRPGVNWVKELSDARVKEISKRVRRIKQKGDFATIESTTGKLVQLQMIPTCMKRFRVDRTSIEDALWIKDALNRESAEFGTQVAMRDANSLKLQWRN